ncbi:GlyGly-CTERM sorting domain-containing protein [Vibrio sp. TRT 21S02]|uniref:GlyGly-CTERM sorting domain-containing protein n=1 Tax=Vibrio sp. TRT 21S02 TaxID=3418507 RepID=UPI003CFA3263
MKPHRLACLMAAAFSLSSPAIAQNLSGVYVGGYSVTMNAHRDNGVNGMPWPENALDGEYNGEKYKVLGTTTHDGFWIWDFDSQTVTIGGSTLFALNMIYVPFQAFNANELENKRADSNVQINHLDEITIPFEYESATGLYKLAYAQKKYIVPPFPVPGVDDYPIGLTTTHLDISQNDDGSLNITTADVEEGIPADNVPGTRIENVFPATVQIEYRSPNLVKDPMTDTNSDGITDTVANLLGLDPISGDTDGDNLDDIIETPIYIRGKDSDNDGLSDALEAGSAANNNAIASGLKLQTQNRVTIATPDAQRIYNVSSHLLDLSIEPTHTLVGELPPQQDEHGEPLDYQYGHIEFNIDNSAADDAINIEISMTDKPEGLEIYRVTKGFSLEAGAFVQSFTKQQWVENNDKIELTLSNPDKLPTVVANYIFAAPEQRSTPPEVTPPTSPEPIPTVQSGESSGGSTGWLSLLALGGLGLRKRKGHQE